MALFKISKGLKANLPATYNEGYCYFTTDDGKFYIDTSGAAAGRICLNANAADKLTTSTAGDSNTPVYFNNGIPVACTSLDLNTTGYARKLAASDGNAYLEYIFDSDAQTGGIYAKNSDKKNRWSLVSSTTAGPGNLVCHWYDDNGTWAGQGTLITSKTIDKYALPFRPNENSTLIPSGADLNTTDYLEVGTYWASTSQHTSASPIVNCPVPAPAGFMMIVQCPDSKSNVITGTWIYRVRKIISHKGIEYIQNVNSNGTAGNFTYSDWRQCLTTGDNYAGSASPGGSATSAEKVNNSLSINGKTFDGSAAVDVGVIGAAYGGTGQTTLRESSITLINALASRSSTPVDEDYYISQQVGGGTTNTAYYRRPMSTLWSYIQGKADDTYVNVSGDTMTGRLATDGITITSTIADEHISFSRGGANYLKAPASGQFCFVSNGKELSIANSDFIIGTDQIYPGTTNLATLGTSNKRWKNVYSTAGNFSGGNVSVANGNVNISRSTTIADNTAARVNFTVTQTDNDVSSTSFIAVFDDLDAEANGCNMVINSKSGTYLTAGEGGANYLANNPSVGENVHLCADSAIYFHTNCNTVANATSTCYVNTAGVLYGACWNDYAEYRAQTEIIKPGYCVTSTDNGQVSKTTEKFQACDGIVSDTFGFAIGETDECKTPLAVAGRVLAYCEGDRYSYHAGDTVCAGPDGKVVKMSREEIREWPDRIVGIVSEIPEYETWGSDNVTVDGRIWIKVK